MEVVGLLLIVAGFMLTVGWAIGFRMGQDSERERQRMARRIEKSYR